MVGPRFGGPEAWPPDWPGPDHDSRSAADGAVLEGRPLVRCRGLELAFMSLGDVDAEEVGAAFQRVRPGYRELLIMVAHRSDSGGPSMFFHRQRLSSADGLGTASRPDILTW